jgi:hypothetical protein
MKIYLYGNCQAHALLKMIREDYPDWSLATADPTTMPMHDDVALQRHYEQIRGADVVVAQPIHNYKGHAELSTDALRAELRGGTELITFPSIVFEGTHGAFSYLPARLSGFHMDYHNSHTIELATRGYHWNDIALLQASPDFYTADFVTGGVEASLGELRHREELAAVTVRVAEIINEYGRSAVVMNTINHPNRFVMARVLNGIYRAMSMPLLAKEQGEDHLPDPIIPPLPTVLAHLRLEDRRPHFEARGRTWTRDAYLRESLGYYGRLLRDDLLRAFVGSRGSVFLEAFHRVPMPLGAIGSAGTVREPLGPEAVVTEAFVALLKRMPIGSELDEHCAAVQSVGLREWFRILTSSEEYFAMNLMASSQM